MPTLSSILGSNFPGAQGETGPTGPTGPQGPAGSDAASYTNADVDTHLNYSTATTGQVLSFSGSDYDWVGGSTTVGDVGTYAFLGRNSNSGSIVAGSTYAGSVLQYAAVISVNSYNYNTALTPEGSSNAGTWRAMGTTNRSQQTKATVFLRIS